jgi:hypothetical protein
LIVGSIVGSIVGGFFLFIVVSPDWAFPIDLDRNSSMNGGLNMASLLIPTTDSFRAQTLIGLLHARDYPVMMVREISVYCTCWLYSLCNFQYRQQYENTCSYNFEC